MKTFLNLVLVLGLALPAVAERMDEEGFARKLAREKAVQDLHADAVVQVKYFMRLGPEGESPDFLGWRGEIENYLDKGFPVRRIGFAVAPDRVLLADPMFRPKWVDRIEVECGGDSVPATESVRYPGEWALELRTARPLGRARPLVFAGKGVPDKPSFLSARLSDGMVETRVKGGFESRRLRGGMSGDVIGTPTDAILLNASNEAVTVCLRKSWDGPEALQAACRPPTDWKGVPAESLEASAKEMDALFARRVVGVYLRFETKPQGKESRFGVFFHGRDSWSGEGKGDERDVFGLILPDGEVFIPVKLSSEDTARLQKIELVRPDGVRQELEFVGSYGDWGGFVARCADGKVPAGLEPCRCSALDMQAALNADGWCVKFVNSSGRVKVDSIRTRFGRLDQQRGGEYVPAVQDASHDRKGTVLYADARGGIVSMDLARRTGTDRYSDAEETIGAKALSALWTSHDYNPEFRPRVDTDRVRTAWIGVDVIALTDELVREKRVKPFLADSRSKGALVGKVYPDTPAAEAGIREGDVLVDLRLAKSRSKTPLELEPSYGLYGFDVGLLLGKRGVLDGTRGRMPWPNVEGGLNAFFSRYGIGTRVVMSYVRDGVRKEAEMTLAQVPEHFLSAPRSRNREIGMTVGDLTFEVRDYFRLSKDAPGVVVMKLKAGDPAAVAGLRAFEIITEVNGEPVTGARDFGRRIKGQKKLSFSVRRLTATRIVRIEL